MSKDATTSSPSPTAEFPLETGSVRLRGQMGTFGLIFTILSFAAPLLSMSGTAPLVIAVGNGIGAPMAFLVGCVLLLIFAIGFTAMTRRSARPGGFYAYISASLGKPVGLGASFLSIIGYLGLLLGTYPLLGHAVNVLVERFGGPAIPWWVWALTGLAIVSVVAYHEVKVSAGVLTVLLALEILILVIVDVAVISQGGNAGLTAEPFTFDAFNQGAVGTALMFCILTFIGFEATAIYRDEVKDPARTVPRATYGALIFMGLFYALTSYVLIMASGLENAVQSATDDPASMLTVAMTRYVAPIMADIQLVLLVTSALAALLAIHNTLARYIHSLGSDRVLPARVGKVHAKFGSPHVASMLTSAVSLAVILIFIFAGSSYVQVYSWLLGIGTYALLPVYALMSLSVIVFFWRSTYGDNLWVRIIAPAISLLGLAATFILASIALPDLIGNSPIVATLSQLGLIVVFVTGIVIANVWKRNQPERYARLGRGLSGEHPGLIEARLEH